MEITFDEKRDTSEESRIRSISSEETSKWGSKAQWVVSRITYPGHAKTTIHIRYEAPYAYEGSFGTCVRLLYGTGNLWKGNLGKAIFIVDSTELEETANICSHTSQAYWTERPLAEKVVKYELKDFKPSLGALFRVCFPRKPCPPPMPVKVLK